MSKGATMTAGVKGALRSYKKTIHRRVEEPSPDGNRRQRRAHAAQQKLLNKLDRLAAAIREPYDWSE